MLVYYNLSNVKALQIKTDSAFKYLEKALEKVFNNFDHIQGNENFVNLRKKKDRWNKLLRKYVKN